MDTVIRCCFFVIRSVYIVNCGDTKLMKIFIFYLCNILDDCIGGATNPN